MIGGTAFASVKPDIREKVTGLICLAGFVVSVIVSADKAFRTMLNLDVAGFLLNARAFELGRTLYDSFFEMNAPANAWLPVVSVKIAHRVPFALADVHLAVLFLFVLGCVAVTLLLMWRLLGARRPITVIVASFVLPATFLLYPGYDFGQREPLFVASLAPFAVVVLARHHGARVSSAAALAAAVLAAFGASLKPHFMLVIGGLLFVDLCLNRGRLRRLGIEVYAVAGLLLAYVVGIAIVSPSYLTEVLPDAAVSYGTMGRPFSLVLEELRWPRVSVTAAFALFLVAVIAFRGRSSASGANLSLAVFWIALIAEAVALYFVQAQGFRYHTLFLVETLAVSIGLSLAWLADDLKLPVGVPALALAAIGVVASWQVGIKLMTYEPRYTRQMALQDPLTQYLNALPPGTPVLMLVTSNAPSSPLHAYTKVAWTGEFSTLVLLRSIYAERDRAAAEKRPIDPKAATIERDFRRFVLDSFTPPPEVVFVAVSQPLRWFEDYPRPVSIIDFLCEQPAFAREWKHYERTGMIRSIYDTDLEIYRRRKDAG